MLLFEVGSRSTLCSPFWHLLKLPQSQIDRDQEGKIVLQILEARLAYRSQFDLVLVPAW
jgi:hypothetical protein